MKLLVCGSRSIENDHWVFNKIDDYILELEFNRKDVTIIEGAARGVDLSAKRWAQTHGLEILEYPAEWDKYGRSAGYIRNDIMVRECDYCLILWDGESKGTRHDIDLCKKYHKNYNVVLRKKIE